MPRALIVLMGMLAFLGCDSGIDPARPDTGTGADGSAAAVTYYEHVRPILVDNCTTCHVEGGIGPFPLTTYEEATEVAARMKEVTAERIMPPFLADNSGACNTWANYRGLTDEEIATIGTSVDTGTLEGDPSIAAPTPVALPELDEVDLTLEMPAEFTTNEDFDDEYRCFVVEGPAAEEYLIGYDVLPGNVQRVHHAIVYSPTSDAEAERARTLDAGEGDATDGYTCFGGAGVSAQPVVLWAPGAGATMFPRRTGIQLAAGRPLILQIHYNNQVASDVPNTDLTRVELAFAESSVSQAYLPVLGDFDLNLPARSEDVVETATVPLDALPLNVRVWGVFPHMHTAGRSLTVDILRGGEDANQCLIDVPRWDFHWQMAYWLTEPMTISPDDMAKITCTYDTMDRDTTTHFGEGTEDEMCLAFVYVTL